MRPKPGAPVPGALTRRDLLRLGAAASAMLGLPLQACERAIDDLLEGEVPVLWLEVGTCTGCGVSLLNIASPDISAVLLEHVLVRFQETLMGAAGDQAMAVLDEVRRRHSGRYLLVVDGSVPRAADGRFTVVGYAGGAERTGLAEVRDLAAEAAGVVALGTCASFGGIPAALPRDTDSVDLATAIGPDARVVRVPGCPPHPDWTASVLVALASGEPVDLDALGRPTPLFSTTVHETCPRLPAARAGRLAAAPGDPEGCFLGVGCKGMRTVAPCPGQGWNGGRSCIGVNHPCIGCVNPGFIDPPEGSDEPGMSPLYGER